MPSESECEALLTCDALKNEGSVRLAGSSITPNEAYDSPLCESPFETTYWINI